MTACKYSNTVTCSDHGTAQEDGSCVCDSGFWGLDCSRTCVDPDFCDWQCNGRGALQGDGSCVCGPGSAPSGGLAIVEHAQKWCGTSGSRKVASGSLSVPWDTTSTDAIARVHAW